jgi:hypothetical protein
VQQLSESRNVAMNQIATLKKHAAQLQSFKKNISNMIQVASLRRLTFDFFVWARTRANELVNTRG